MNIVEFISNWWKETLEYKERVLKDGGTVKRDDNVQKYIQMCKQNGMYESIKFGFLSDAGSKLRNVSTSENRWSKLYTLKQEREIARRNLLTYTEEFNNAAWTKLNATVTPDAANSPTDAFSADKLIEDSSSSQHYIEITPGATGQISTLSVYAKAGERNILYLYLGGSGSGLYFNLSNGTTGSNYVGAPLSSSITLIGNGWYRCSITASTSITPRIGLCINNNASSYQGDGTSGIYIWGAQLEVGSSPSAYQRVIDSSSWDGVMEDATQTTSTSQPYLTGNIAPNEKWGLKNPNGGSMYMTHPTISFAANEAWSVTTVVNWNGNSSTAADLWGSSSMYGMALRASSINQFTFTSFSGVYVTTNIPTNLLFGKNSIITFVGNNGIFKIYNNGNLVYTSNYSSNGTDADLGRIFAGKNGASYSLNSSISAHIIRSQALTPSQVAAEANYLRSQYPEIPSVTIGSQTWATSNCDMAATPQGNLIANVTENANVEKITNAADRDFSSDTGFWTKSGETTISAGVCNIKTTTGVTSGIEKPTLLTSGRWYRLKYDVVANRNGGLQIYNGSSVQSISSTVGNNKLFYFYAGGAYFNIARTGAIVDIDIDNVSVQEVGWSGSTDLYNGIYAQTSGTEEQKTYAAVKAAAMWCYYNNDAAVGAIYGKLYNWYAVKLLQMDIDYYNIANPTTPWGWRVPTDTDFNTLATTLGGASVAGGKMKKDGLVYWASPNTGADNSSGFSAIGGGVRSVAGLFTSILVACRFREIGGTFFQLNSSDSAITQSAVEYESGRSLRLIKN